jgi:bifunctional non-homologous end joining protein LigD
MPVTRSSRKSRRSPGRHPPPGRGAAEKVRGGPRSGTVAARPPKRAGGATALAPARFIPPMKALSVEQVPAGKWRLEIKLDGYRALALLNRGAVELWSRNRKPLTADYPELAAALAELRCANAVLDGEIVALDAEGRSRFQLLQGRGAARARAAIVYYVFDLLHLDGESWLRRPLEERQARLAALAGKNAGVVRCSPVFAVEPAVLLASVRERGLEGIIAKRPGSLYEPDARSGAWLKCKVHGEQEFVIGGFSPPKNSRPHLGAILVGYYDGGEFIYAGKVGSGFDHARLASLHAALVRRKIAVCPFANLPLGHRSRFGVAMNRAAMREITWVKPELVCQVRFAEWTQEGLLRQPVFLGLRDDKRARDVVRESGPGDARVG